MACSSATTARQAPRAPCTLSGSQGSLFGRGAGRAARLPAPPAGAPPPLLARCRAHPPTHLPRATPLPLQEHTGSSSQGDDLLASLSVPTTAMAKNLGSSGGGSATLQRSKLSNKQSAVQRGPKLDDGMGGGGIGKGIFNGGGGDGDGGDDDDYFNEFGERILSAT